MTVGLLGDRVWLHLGARPPEHAAGLARRTGGVVLQAPLSSSRARNIARLGIPVMLQHSGVALTTEGMLFRNEDEAWLDHQTDPAVGTTRTTWVPKPSHDASLSLRTGIIEAQRFLQRAEREWPGQPCVSVFAVSYHWLTSLPARTELLSALRIIDGPVGLMFGKSLDPLDNARAVEGLVALVTGLPEVVILRCDHGLLGAYAFGALGGSIGINPTARHYVVPGSSGWAELTDRTPRVFLRSILAWWRGSRLGYYEGEELFNDDCAVCRGSSLARFQDETLTPEADAHSVETWSSIFSELRGLEPGRRADHWIKLCSQAYDILDALEDLHDGLPHPPSKQLKAWLRFAGIRAV